MTELAEVFRNSKVVLPVIHVSSTKQALRNARIAQDCGADGVFLINHVIEPDKLLRCHRNVTEAFSDLWIGLNCLGWTPAQVFESIPRTTDGVWVDNALIREGQDRQDEAEYVLEVQRRSNWSGLYFGGTAFKYQPAVTDLRNVTRTAAAYMDVVTTSGPATGEAASVDKIRSMKEALGDRPLAIASGITPDNVDDYLGVADCFLVATGISKTFDELCENKARALVGRVHGWSHHG